MTIGLGPKIRMVKLGIYLYWCPGCNAAHQFNIAASDHPQGLRWGWDGDGHHPTIEPDMTVTGAGCSDSC
jgi:hypothetical protein